MLSEMQLKSLADLDREKDNRIAELEDWARDAINFIDNPSPDVSPTLIVLAGRTLLEKGLVTISGVVLVSDKK